MDYCRFLENLLSEGRALVAEPAPISEEQWKAGDAVLAKYERIWRRDLPEPIAEFNPDSARWGAAWLVRACQFAIYRDVDASAIREALSGRFPRVVTASDCYSVDLVFRFLPDLERFAKSAAEGDPLVGQVRAVAAEWPLSTVGMPDLGPVKIDGFADHPGLMQLYVDRILVTEDASRLGDERVRRQIQSTLGKFPELAPRFAAECLGHTLETQNE